MAEAIRNGDELGVFAGAKNWKAYFGSFLPPGAGKRVLEVGAGIGGTTSFLCSGEELLWLCLEPDPRLLSSLESLVSARALPRCCQARAGTIHEIQGDARFDIIYYIDVLEHIEHDAAELRAASRLLSRGGRLVVLAPAFSCLYSRFDRSIGHFRRYTAATLASLTPAGLEIDSSVYLDALGILLSLANRILLRQALPTVKQIEFWDRNLVPPTRLLDRLLGFRLGRSIVCIWRSCP
jgi:SAM-dependent methyltransferase